MMTWQTQLQEMTGFNQFKPGQLASLNALSKNENVIAILPTGGGKSLIYQLHQYKQAGLTVIVSPLISLMADQVGQIQTMGIGRGIALNSSYSKQEQGYILQNLHQYQYLFLSPEMLLKDLVLSSLKRMTICLLVIDEAHCISQWGYDFRPQYTELKRVRGLLNYPKTLALSATASENTLQDIREYLFNESEPVTLIQESVDRPNIFYLFDELSEDENRVEHLLNWLVDLPKPGIVYVHQKSELEELAQLVKGQTDLELATYHGDRTLADRHIIQSQFIHGEIDVIFATSAFGMGINHSDIRFVLHYHLPKNMADFIQEIGRAGRDQDQALSVVMYDRSEQVRLHQMRRLYEDEADLLMHLLDQLYSGNLSLEDASQYSESITAMLYFYQNHFKDLKSAKIHAQHLLAKKIEQIQQVIKMMHFDGCYRELLLGQAAEKLEEKIPFCCSHCNPNYETSDEWIELMALDKKLKSQNGKNTQAKNSDNWRHRLNQLFA